MMAGVRARVQADTGTGLPKDLISYLHYILFSP